jgi:hypothetical protein
LESGRAGLCRGAPVLTCAVWILHAQPESSTQDPLSESAAISTSARSPIPHCKNWHSDRMESRVDLDQVARLISRHAISWEQAGLAVDALTWRDAAGAWPYPLREDRSQVTEADSVGVTARKGEQAGQLVIFRGGWADLEYWSGCPSDEALTEAPGWDDRMDLPGTEQLLLRFAALFG